MDSQTNKSRRSVGGARRLRRTKSAFLLVMVLLVVAGISLGALTYLEMMANSNEVSRLESQQTQARYIADSGIELTRFFLANTVDAQEEAGGWWNNPQRFQAVNVVPDIDPKRIGNFSIIAPNLDETGNLSGIRYGLQNESARLNLNALIVIDEQYGAAAGALGAIAGSGAADLSSMGISSSTASQATQSGSLENIGRDLLMGLPGMTEDVADSILDWLDEDDDPREYGAESEYYSQLTPPYEPTNGPIHSVEQLLLVRGVTPQLLFGLDQNRNGLIDAGEQSSTLMGGMGMGGGMMPSPAVGGMTTTAPTTTTSDGSTDTSQPDPLGWATYLTLHSREKNVGRDGTPRVYLNQSDLATLQEELTTALGNETFATFIVAYRRAGKSGASATDQGSSGSSGGGTIGGGGASSQVTPIGGSQSGAGSSGAGGASQGGGGAAAQRTEPWNSAVLDTVQGEASVNLTQVLDLIDATVTAQVDGQSVTYTSPFTSEIAAMGSYLPLLMDKVTCVDGDSIPGRININQCPRPVLMGIPSMTSELADEILQARGEESESENRKFETWLLAEGLVTVEQMRTFSPLITGGGSVYRAQIIGYFEQGAAFSRIEAIIDSAAEVPKIAFYRRLDHLGRGFDLGTLGQRSGGGLGLAQPNAAPAP